MRRRRLIVVLVMQILCVTTILNVSAILSSGTSQKVDLEVTITIENRNNAAELDLLYVVNFDFEFEIGYNKIGENIPKEEKKIQLDNYPEKRNVKNLM